MAQEDTFYAHIIFSTKGWEQVLTPDLMKEITQRMKRNFELRDSELLFIKGGAEHIHILGRFSRSLSFSRIIGWSKGECSHWLNMQYPELKFKWQKGFWFEEVPQDRYKAVLRYIEDQDSLHQTTTFMEEIMGFRKGQK